MKLLLASFVPLTAGHAMAEDAGRALFYRGEGAVAILSGGTVQVPGTAFPCANCHGADALGGREGGVVAPALAWSRLTAPTPERPAYDEQALATALAEGRDPSGRQLGAVMPRFEASPETVLALAATLADIESEQQAGIYPSELVLRPPSNPEARAGFDAAMIFANEAGGAHGRLLRSARPDEAAALDLANPFLTTQALKMAEARSLLSAAAADGVTSLVVAGEAPDDSLRVLARAAGTDLVPSAAAALVLQPLSDEEAATLQASAIYARRDALTPVLIAAAARPGVRLVVTEPFPEAAQWARADREGHEAVIGYSVALMTYEAAILVGRTASVSRLEAALSEIADRDVSLRRFEAPGDSTFARKTVF